MNRNQLSAELLEARVHRIPWSGCWIWMGTLNTNGYGILSLDGKNRLAHRSAWTAFFADPGKLHVLHRCDERTCINPAHLFLGTHSDNMLDRARKGKQSGGWPRKVADGFGDSPAARLSFGQR